MPKSELIKPIGRVLSEVSPHASVYTLQTPAIANKTEAQLYDQGITYNEAGYTYNQSGVAYGGVYGAQDTRPMVSLAQSLHPTIVGINDIPGAVVDTKMSLGPGFFMYITH